MPLTLKLTFNKDRVKKSGEARIYLRITIDRQTKPMKLDFYWPTDKINEDKGLLLQRYPEDPDVQRRNLQVKNRINDITDIETQYSLRRRILTIELLFRDIGFYKRRMTLVKWMEYKIMDRFNDGEIEVGTKKNGFSTIDTLKSFRKSAYIDDVNKTWLTKYASWLRKKGNAPGTIWGRIKDIKAYLSYAEREVMLVVDTDYRNYQNSPPETDTVFLNQRELNLLFNLVDNVEITPLQRKVLMAFLFQCTTSLRISDVYRANSEWNLDPDALQFIPKKGSKKRVKKLVVPIMPGAKTFIGNLNGMYFNLPTEQEYNRSLKEIALKAGIHKNLSSHAGRHTYGYLFMKYIGNMKALQMIMGHKSPNTTQRYAHLEDQDLFNAVMKMQREINISSLKKAE
jgi:integrase/recombinase XerD